MKKRIFLSVILLSGVLLATPAIGLPLSTQTHTYTGQILSADPGNAFGVSTGDPINWSATFPSYIPDGEYTLPFYANPAFNLSLPIGIRTFTALDDADYSDGWPLLFFSDRSLTGVDILVNPFMMSGYPEVLFGFTTHTPLPTETPDFTTFSVFQYTLFDINQGVYDAEEIISGTLFADGTVVPLPPAILLLGTGLAGMSIFRKRRQADPDPS